MSIRIREVGVVELVLPRFVSERAGAAFITSRQEWIEHALLNQNKRNAIQKPVVFADGALVPCFGDFLQLSLVYLADTKRATVRVQGSLLTVRAKDKSSALHALETWYKKEALAYCVGQSNEYAELLGVPIAAIRVIHMKTQWGSCNTKAKALTFNWKLALAPEEVAWYVVAHEVAHLVQANHSKAFWNIVRTLDPHYMAHRKWLKIYGGGLYIVNT